MENGIKDPPPTRAQRGPQRMIPYVLVGKMKGKTGKFMNIVFVNGRASIPQDVHENVGHVLREDYSALPAQEAETREMPAITAPSTQEEDVPEPDDIDIPEDDKPTAKKHKK